MNEPTKQQWEQFNKHHVTEVLVTENKWLGNMSKDEIKDGYDEVQRELNGEKDV